MLIFYFSLTPPPVKPLVEKLSKFFFYWSLHSAPKSFQESIPNKVLGTKRKMGIHLLLLCSIAAWLSQHNTANNTCNSIVRTWNSDLDSAPKKNVLFKHYLVFNTIKNYGLDRFIMKFWLNTFATHLKQMHTLLTSD